MDGKHKSIPDPFNFFPRNPPRFRFSGASPPSGCLPDSRTSSGGPVISLQKSLAPPPNPARFPVPSTGDGHKSNARVAQLVEQLAFNQLVQGSSPCPRTFFRDTAPRRCRDLPPPFFLPDSFDLIFRTNIQSRDSARHPPRNHHSPQSPWQVQARGIGMRNLLRHLPVIPSAAFLLRPNSRRGFCPRSEQADQLHDVVPG